MSSNQQEEDPESIRSSNESSALARYFALAVVVAAAFGASVYVLHRNGVDIGSAISEARTTSADAATTAAVKTALALSSKVSAFDIDVATTEGVVRLDGVVPSESIRELTVAIASDTAGVDGVDDLLKVESSARPSPEIDRLKMKIADLEIRSDLNDALLRNPGLEGREIEFTVDQRNVVLHGAVDTPDLKRSVERVALSINNVRDVINELRVLDDADDMDAHDALAKQVRFELYATGAFNLELMDVRTVDGVVTLMGQVRSHAEKLLAERIVTDINGVEAVENDLDVIAVPFRA